MNEPARSLCPKCLRLYSLEAFLNHPCVRHMIRAAKAKPIDAQSATAARAIDKFYRRVTK